MVGWYHCSDFLCEVNEDFTRNHQHVASSKFGSLQTSPSAIVTYQKVGTKFNKSAVMFHESRHMYLPLHRYFFYFPLQVWYLPKLVCQSFLQQVLGIGDQRLLSSSWISNMVALVLEIKCNSKLTKCESEQMETLWMIQCSNQAAL